MGGGLCAVTDALGADADDGVVGLGREGQVVRAQVAASEIARAARRGEGEVAVRPGEGPVAERRRAEDDHLHGKGGAKVGSIEAIVGGQIDAAHRNGIDDGFDRVDIFGQTDRQSVPVIAAVHAGIEGGVDCGIEHPRAVWIAGQLLDIGITQFGREALIFDGGPSIPTIDAAIELEVGEIVVGYAPEIKRVWRLGVDDELDRVRLVRQPFTALYPGACAVGALKDAARECLGVLIVVPDGRIERGGRLRV